MSDTLEDYPPCDPTEICIRSIVRRAYGLIWDHFVLLVSAHLIILLILFLGNYVLLKVGGFVLLGPFILGAFKISLRIVRNENTELADLLSGFEHFLPAFVANILINVFAIAAGFLLVIPGLLVFLTYSATYFFILEEDQGFWDAMESSRKMVWGNFKRWLAVGVVLVAINLIGLACCGVGLLISVPFSHLLITLAYEEEREARRKVESGLLPRAAQPVSDI